MRVLHWTESFWPRIGGSEVAAAALINQLRRRGHQFEVVTRQWSPDQPITEQWDGVAVHRVPFDDGTFDRLNLEEILPLRQRVAAIKRQFKPDLVHVGLTGPSLFLHNFTAGQFPAPTVITLHVLPVETEFARNKPVRETFRAATWAVAVSHAMAKQIRDRVPQMDGRCSVIHNALPESPAPLMPVSFSPPRLLCVGRVTELKGFDTAVAAMPLVRKAFPDAELVIAGDGDATESLRELAWQLDILGCVQILGWKPPEDVPGLIDAATLVLVPSRKESFGLVALQVAQRGRVCLAANVDGLPEIVQHDRTGLLLPPDQPEHWANAICSLLRDRPRIEQLGSEARDFVSRQFSLTQHVDAYESLYRRLIGGERRQEAIA
jgi:glycosyltransferase involved in cell wall biosynthesis